MEFFGIGISEFFIIVIFALIFFKPEEIPGIVKKAIEGIKKIRSFSFNVKEEMNKVYEDQIRPYAEEIKKEIEKNANAIETTKETLKKEIESTSDDLKKQKNEISETIQQKDTPNPH